MTLVPDRALFHCPKCGKYFIRVQEMPWGKLLESSPEKEVLMARTLRGDHIARWPCRTCRVDRFR
jgi:hypothetical protein